MSSKSAHESVVYFKKSEDLEILVGIYVDVLLITRSCSENVKEFSKNMQNLFELTDLGLFISYFGVQTKHVSGEIFRPQKSQDCLKIIK